METKVIKIDDKHIDMELINQAAKLIKAGKIVAFPTETVYGLGANGLNEKAVEGLFKAKGRPQDNPLILHISSLDQLKTLVLEVPDIAYECRKRFWPGPLTMIFKKSEIVPYMITGGLETVAIRMPKNKIALELIKEANVPIAGPSANLSGRPSPTNASHVIEDLFGKIDMIIDGGDTGVGLESTVLDVSGDAPMILRPGGVTFEDLKEFIPNLTQDLGTIKSDNTIVPKSPGQKYKHYAPKADMYVYTGNIDNVVKSIINQSNKHIKEGKKVGIMATTETKDMYDKGTILIAGSRNDRNTIAANLFKTLRIFDEEKVDIILAEGVETDNIGRAIMNRMMKASGGKIINV